MQKIIIIFLIFILSEIGFAQQFNILPKPQQISQHVYAWIGPYGGPSTKNKGYRMNMAFVVGQTAVAVLDSGFYPAMAEEMVERIKEITPLPIKYVINTNSQPDRYLGNDVFHALGAEIITSQKEAKRMQEFSSNHALFVEMTMKFRQQDIVLPSPPTRLIQKQTTINLGGKVNLELHLYKAGHTPQPIIAHIQSDNIVYAGDTLYSGRLIAIVPGGNIREWKQTYQYLKRFQDAVFIPGHGMPAHLSAFDKPTYAYLDLLDQHMSKMVEAGIDMQDAILRLDQSAFSELANFKELAGRNANLAYQEAERASFEN